MNLSPAMRLAVDVSILELPCPTGVERVAREIVQVLPSVLSSSDVLLVLGRGEIELPSSIGHGARVIGLGGREPLAVWRETRLVKALRSQNADVLWSPVAAIPVRTRVPRVATVHELPWRVRPGLEGTLRERVHRARLAVAVKAAARIVVPSASAREQLVADAPAAADRVRVVGHGVPARFRRPVDAGSAAELRALHLVPSTPYVLHVGGTRPRKNVPLLLRAFARYRLRGGTWPLVLAGPGDPPTRLPAAAYHLGYVSEELLAALYDGAGALAVSSESEGFGLPVIEAMTVAVPVVTTRAGGLVETAGDAALAVDPDDEEGLADALLRLEREPETREDLIERGRAHAAGFTWEQAAVRLHAVLAEACELR